jgi:hypothetical protein
MELWTRVALSLSTLFAVGLDKLPVGNGKTKTKNTQMSKSVDYFKVLNLLLSCFWFLHFALGSTGNRERRGNKRRKATKSGPRRFKVTVQLANNRKHTEWFPSHASPPSSRRYTHIKIKTREKRKKKLKILFVFPERQWLGSVFSVANSTPGNFNPIIGTASQRRQEASCPRTTTHT